MNSYKLTVAELEAINELKQIRRDLSRLSKIVPQSGKIISRLTNHPVIALASHSGETEIRRFEFVPVGDRCYVLVVVKSDGEVKSQLVRVNEEMHNDEPLLLAKLFNTFLSNIVIDEAASEKLDLIIQMSGNAKALAEYMSQFLKSIVREAGDSETFFEGASRLLSYPEFRDPERAGELIDFLSDSKNVKNIHLKQTDDSVGVAIGTENEVSALRDTSVVYKAYKLPDGMYGILAVVGPTRMDYSKTAARLDAFEKGMRTVFSDSEFVIGQDEQNFFDNSNQED